MRGDVYWLYDAPHTSGSELAGRHPCIDVTREGVGLERRRIVVPCSDGRRRGHKFYPTSHVPIDIENDATGRSVQSVALCDQITTASYNRLSPRRWGWIDDMYEVEQAMRFILDLPER